MFFPSATTVAAIVLSLVGGSPLEARATANAAAAAAPARASIKVAAGLWAPKKAAKPRPARDDSEREEELLKPRAPTGGETTARPTKRRPIKMDDSVEEEEEEEGEEEEDEDRPKVVKKRKRVVEEDQDVEEPLESQPSVIPRLVNVGLGGALVRRSFAYNEAARQGDKGFRAGYALVLESYPFVTQPSGAYRTLGVGAYYEAQYGDAIYESAMTGMFNGYGFKQSRWGFDVRWGIPIGQWVVIMPAVGYGRASADLQRSDQPVVPSMCGATDTMVCFADITAAYLSADLHLRVGVTPTFALSLAGGYLAGLGVAQGMDQITSEGNASMNGFHVDVGGMMLINDYLAVQATVPIRRYGYAYGAPAGARTYQGATDMYYGLIAGIAVMTK
jgi:hypothetical protein